MIKKLTTMEKYEQVYGLIHVGVPKKGKMN
jgi:hypothetical protein